MLTTIPSHIRSTVHRIATPVRRQLPRWGRPLPPALALGPATDVVRSRRELIVENALLRRQLPILHRRVKGPRPATLDRGLIVQLAGRLRSRAQALVIVQPATVLRWHRQGSRLFRRRQSATRPGKARIPTETAAPIRRMAAENRPWGADRMRGELRKRGIRVSKRTVQKHLRSARPRRPAGRRWSAVVRDHAADIRACDFHQPTDLRFRPLYASFAIALGPRRVAHVGVTRHPTDARVARQLRDATPSDERPRCLIRENDATYGAVFERLAAAIGIRVLRTPIRAPRANGTRERFLGNVRRHCLVHVLVLGERHLARLLAAYFNRDRPHQALARASTAPCRFARCSSWAVSTMRADEQRELGRGMDFSPRQHLRRVLDEYVRYFNHDRPHHVLAQRIPEGTAAETSGGMRCGSVRAVPILGGLHHAYAKAVSHRTDRPLGQDRQTLGPPLSRNRAARAVRRGARCRHRVVWMPRAPRGCRRPALFDRSRSGKLVQLASFGKRRPCCSPHRHQ